MTYEARKGWLAAPCRASSVMSVLMVPMLLLGLASPTGCTATQMVGLDVGPEPLILFVDGERMDQVPPELELTANRDHTLFFQREGYLSQLIVVKTTELGGKAHLEPERVKLRLRRDTATAPEVSVEIEAPPEAR